MGNSDLKLLDQHYMIDRTEKKEKFRLNIPQEDENLRLKLAKVVQKGAKSVCCSTTPSSHLTSYVLFRYTMKGPQIR